MTDESGHGKPGEASPDRRALDDVFSVTYAELRRLASAMQRNDANGALPPPTRVHEAWLKLASSPEFASTSPLHFKRIAARAMRQVLVEAARRRNAQKRGGRAVMVTFDDSLAEHAAGADELLALDELARMQPRQALMVEGRFFGGLDVSETAQLLQVSEATVLRDWRAAKAWLAHELRGAR
jgi:RNA polymerase sigma factor (TIGR02999 family)